MQSNVDILYEQLKEKFALMKENPRKRLKFHSTRFNQNYIVQSYMFDHNMNSIEYKRRFYTHLESANKFVFMEKLQGRYVDLFDNKAKEFI